MKRLTLLLTLIALYMLSGTALADRYVCFTGVTASPVAGVTTVASGTSNVWISGVTLIEDVDLTDGAFTFQLTEIEMAKTGDTSLSANSGATLTVSYRISEEDETGAWSAAEDVVILDGMALSGNTRRATPFYPTTHTKFMRLYLTTGITPFYKIRGKLNIMDNI